MLLSHTVSVVTGGGSGIGRAIAELFAREGSTVVVADLHGDRAEAVASAIDEAGGTAMAVEADVSTPEGVAHIFERAESVFGPVDILVNNAGIMNEGTSANYMEHSLIIQSAESFDRMIAINLVGVFNGVHEFGPGMAERGEGHIVNTSSSQGLISCGGVGAYCAATLPTIACSICSWQ